RQQRDAERGRRRLVRPEHARSLLEPFRTAFSLRADTWWEAEAAAEGEPHLLAGAAGVAAGRFDPDVARCRAGEADGDDRRQADGDREVSLPGNHHQEIRLAAARRSLPAPVPISLRFHLRLAGRRERAGHGQWRETEMRIGRRTAIGLIV